MYNAPQQDYGGEFPRGSGSLVVYAGGFLVGSIKGGAPVVSEALVVGAGIDFQPGRITSAGMPFSQLTAEDPNAPGQEAYLIDRSMSGADYANWPADAPHDQVGRPGLIADAQTWTVFNDLDVSLSDFRDATNPGLGIQVALESFAFNSGLLSNVVFLKFTIMNKTNTDYDSSYIGLYMDPDLGENNGYLNDLTGVDTAKGLGFVYNSVDGELDESVGIDFFQGPVVDTAEVPAELAAKFAEYGKTLVWDSVAGVYVSNDLPDGHIWLGATTFNTASGTSGEGWPRNDAERYNLLRGFHRDGTPKYGSGINDYFAFRGNPLILSQNDPDIDNTPDDERIIHGVGPFTMKAGESQVIWAGVIGGLGNSRLDAVRDMFTTDSLAQAAFDVGFIVPEPPDIPRMQVIPLDRKVTITWEDNAEFSIDRAGTKLGIRQDNGYTVDYDSTDFQGYRVYRSRTGLPGGYQLLAQYDLADSIKIIQNVFINSNGHVEKEDVNLGTDTGLRYHFTDSTVVNGQRYFYSVTAYDAQPYIARDSVFIDDPILGEIQLPSGLPITLESPQSSNVVSVVPSGSPAPFKFDAAAGNVTRISGGSTGTVKIEVVDPNSVTGHDYRIEFFEIPDSIGRTPVRGLMAETLAYRIVDMTIDSTVRFSNRADDPATFVDRNFDGLFDSGDSLYDDRFYNTAIALEDDDHTDENFGIADGMLIGLFEPLPTRYFRSVTYVPGPQYEAIGVVTPWFTGPEKFSNSALDKSVSPPDSSLGTFGVVYSDVPLESRRNVDVVFSRDSSNWQNAYAHTSHMGQINRFVRVPFLAYDVDSVDGDPSPRPLNIKISDRNVSGQSSLAWALANGLNSQFGGLTDNTGPQTRGFVGIDTTSYDLSGYTGGSGNLSPGSGVLYGTTPSQSPVYAVFTPTMRDIESLPAGASDGKDWNDSCKAIFGSDASVDQGRQGLMYGLLPDEGIIQIRFDHPFTANDSYVFSTTANTTITSKKELRKQLKNIKAVPNPYYGRSSYQSDAFDKVIKFINLPAQCTIRIFTVSGDLVRTIRHHSSSNNDRINTDPLTTGAQLAPQETAIERWDLRNTRGRFVASGMYIAIVDATGGRVAVKFAVIQEENIPGQ